VISAREAPPRWLLVTCLVGLGMLACDGSSESAVRPALTRDELLNPETCKDCHPKHYTEWSASMHAYASKDPVFLAMNKRGQEETNGTLGKFCVQCHMPMALHENKIADFANVEQVPEALQGVTCYFCHNATSVGVPHNNANITLGDDNIMRAALDHALIPSVHKVQFSNNHDPEVKDSSVMCGTCHDIQNQQGFHLENTLSEYETTTFARADPASFQSCQNCHMPRADVPQAAALSSGYPGVFTRVRDVHDHLFPAVDVPLTDFPHADALREAVEKCELPSSIVFFNVALRSPLGDFEVQIETQAGHAQPSGATQDRRLWLEIDYFDDAGKLLYSDGVIPDGQVEEPDGQPAHPCMLRDRVAGVDGKETHMFWEAATSISSKLIPPPTNNMAGGHTQTCYFRPRQLGTPVPRMEMRLRMRPVGVDVLQDLVASGHLASEFVAKMPTMTVDRRVATYDATPGVRAYHVDQTTPTDCATYKRMLSAAQALTDQAGAAAPVAGSGP
jgi:Cytochrome c554 and c-prime